MAVLGVVFWKLMIKINTRWSGTHENADKNSNLLLGMRVQRCILIVSFEWKLESACSLSVSLYHALA
jgi:hypothetical protein